MNRWRVAGNVLFIAALAFLLATECVFAASEKSPRFERLPPLKPETTQKPSARESFKEKKFPRRIYRLHKNEYDLKIVYSGKKKKGFLSSDDSQIGSAILCADINGDGIDDIVIGAPSPEGPLKNRKNGGRVHVIFGKKELPRFIDAARSGLILTMPPQAHSTRFGQAVASGDINGDGLKDLILGAPHAVGGNKVFRAGEVYIVYGRKKMSGKKNILKVADVTISGLEVSSETGFAVASGDLNGDGRDDIIIGAPGANRDNKMMAGRTYIIFGRKKMPRRLSLSVSWDVRLTGIDGPHSYLSNFTDSPDRSGSSLATGDINHDGLDDLVIGAPYANGPNNDRPGAGEVYVLYGKKDFRRSIDLAAESDSTLWGAVKRTFAGYSLASGDIDGDGFDDIIIGTGDPHPTSGKKQQIGAYVVYGTDNLPFNMDLRQDSGLVLKDRRKRETASLFPGKKSVDYYKGYSTAVGDLNGDGVADLLLGTPGNAGNRGKAAYIVSGQKRTARIKNLPEQFDGIVLHANKEDAQNNTVATGDINGDGKMDILIRTMVPEQGSGIFVIFGRN